MHHRKIPGLVSYESDEVYKLKERPHDRRLVQAVIGKNSCLVGKTPTDAKFRTRYGAAVIAINRGGRRLHQHPGKVQLRGERETFRKSDFSIIFLKINSLGMLFVLFQLEMCFCSRLGLVL